MATAAPGSDRSHNRGERLRDHAREMQTSLTGLQSAAHEIVEELSAAAREQLEVRPYATLGAFFALGWILGGGLTPRILRRLGSFGGRMAVSMAVQRVVRDRSDAQHEGPPGGASATH